MSRESGNRPRRPDQLDIQPQRMDFDFRDVPRYWFGGDPVRTHFLDVLSLTFPEGERFFVDSVRALRQQALNASQKDISGFIGQEAMHSEEHRTFNELLECQGYGKQARGGEALARLFLKGARKYLGRRQQLAVTAGLEHITAILANHLLKDGGMVEEMDTSVRDLWVWHAIEETEHKAVAFDLYLDTGANYPERVFLFLGATSFLGVYAAIYLTRFLAADRLWKHPGLLVKGLGRLARTLAPVVPDYLAYLRPGFHPWHEDNSHLVLRWRAHLNTGYQAA